MPSPIHQHQEQPVGQLGANAHGEVLEAGRVSDCYLGLRLDPADDAQAADVLGSPRRCYWIRWCRSRTAPWCMNC